jgi:hypothetical protein
LKPAPPPRVCPPNATDETSLFTPCPQLPSVRDGDHRVVPAVARRGFARTAQLNHAAGLPEHEGTARRRPGRNANAGATNAANYHPAKANPFPDLPDPLVTKDGRKVTTPELWWKVRRPEIVEDSEREISGRMPRDVPKVSWSIVTQATDRVVGTNRVIARLLTGHVDNSACPSIKVEIQMNVVTPANAGGPVPVLMMFGGSFGGIGLPRHAGEPPVNTSLLDGELAWRQHDGGHEDRSNMKHFIAWASGLLEHTLPAGASK